jgi:hypothetical protein
MKNNVQIGSVYRYKRGESHPLEYRQQNEYYENNNLFIMILGIHPSPFHYGTDSYDVLRWEMNKKNKTIQKTRSNFRVIHQFDNPDWWEEYLSCDNSAVL